MSRLAFSEKSKKKKKKIKNMLSAAVVIGALRVHEYPQPMFVFMEKKKILILFH